MKSSVFIFGPQGSGKTRNAEAIKAFFKLREVVDGWTVYDAYPKCGAVILTQIDPRHRMVKDNVGRRKCRVFKIEDVKRVLTAKGTWT